MIKPSRPQSLVEHRAPPTRDVQLKSRPTSLGGGESTSSVNTIYLEDSVETLMSARLPAQNMDYTPDPTHPQALSGRPYSTAMGRNSSATLRNSSSFDSTRARWAIDGVVKSHATEDGGVRRKEADTRAVRIRYLLMLTHASLLIVKLAHTVYLRDSLVLIMIVMTFVAFLIYMPAAFGLSLARKGSHFDHVGGEVAYLAVQTFLWAFSTYWALDMLWGTDCSEKWDWFENGVYAGTSTNQEYCTNAGVSGGLSLVHTLILSGWTGWIIWFAVMRGRQEPGMGGVWRCFQVSTHWLLRGWPVVGGISGPPY